MSIFSYLDHKDNYFFEITKFYLIKTKNPPNFFGGLLTKPYVGQSTDTFGGEVN